MNMSISEFREHLVNILTGVFQDQDQDVLRTGSNELSFPFVDKEQNEQWAKITVVIPKGSRDGTPYDGYEKAEEYQQKQEEQKRKKEEREQKKKEKIEQDKKRRELKRKKEEKEKEEGK